MIHINGTLLWIAAITIFTIELHRTFGKKREGAKVRLGTRVILMALITTILSGSTGFYFLYAWDIWNRLFEMNFWWIHAMILAWILFVIVFFLIDPLILKRSE